MINYSLLELVRASSGPFAPVLDLWRSITVHRMLTGRDHCHDRVRDGFAARDCAGYRPAASKHARGRPNHLAQNPLRRRLASTRKVDHLALPGVKIRTSVSLARSSESVESKHTSIDLVSVRTRPKVSLASYAPRLISHFTASAWKELPERVTSRVPRVCQTWLRALRTDPVTAWSGWAKRDHQRTMYMDTSPAACQDHLMHPPLRLRPVRRRSFRFTALSASCRGMITF